MNAGSRKPSESEIDVDLILGGDERAFEELVRMEIPRLFRLVFRTLNDEDEARSIVQETFLQAYNGLADFRRESKFTTWLYGIALNLARSARRQRRRTELFDEQDVERLQPAFWMGMYREQVDRWDPSRVSEKNDRVRLVREAVDRLP